MRIQPWFGLLLLSGLGLNGSVSAAPKPGTPAPAATKFAWQYHAGHQEPVNLEDKEFATAAAGIWTCRVGEVSRNSGTPGDLEETRLLSCKTKDSAEASVLASCGTKEPGKPWGSQSLFLQPNAASPAKIGKMDSAMVSITCKLPQAIPPRR